MSDSLQDQLRALGIASDKPRGKKSQRKKPASAKKPGSPRRKSAPKSTESDLEKAYRLKKEAERAEGERTRREKQAADERNRKINARLRLIVEKRAVNDAEAEGVRNFLDRGKIRNVHVTDAQQEAIQSGELGVCYLAGRYFLLPLAQLEEVRKISAAHIVDLGLGDEQAKD